MKTCIVGKRLEGQITIFAALTITLVMSLIMVCIKSVLESSIKTKFDLSSRLSAEAVFSGYSNKLLDEFDIFMLKKSDMINSDLKEYMEENCSSFKNQKSAEFQNAYFDEFSYATDNAGENIKKEILDYMKLGLAAEYVGNLTNTSEQIEKTEAINEITEDVVSCQDSACEQDAAILQLVKLVEGLEVTNSGIALSSGKPVALDDYFAKSVLTQKLSMQSAGIDNNNVYEVVSCSYGKYINVTEILEDMYSDVEDTKYYSDDIEDLNTLYADNYKRLKEAINSASGKTNEAIEEIKNYQNKKDNTKVKIGECKNKLESKKDVLGDDVYKSFNDDLTQMNDEQNDNKKMLCDIKTFEEGLLENKQVYTSVSAVLKKLNVKISMDNYTTVLSDINELKELLKGLNNSKLKFNYSGIDFSNNSEGTGSIKKIYKMLTEGIAGLVLDGKDISQKEIEYTDLASDMSAGSDGGNCDIAEKALVNEYIFLKFNSFTDYLNEDNTVNCNTNKQLDYVVEYIIGNQKSDKENLNKVIMQLSVLREGVNLAHIITDPTKKKQALTLATSLVGFTGNMVIIKAAQYLIMSAWAYGESLIEIKQLMNGEKVELIKNKDNWNLSLQNLLETKFESDKDKKSDKGLNYEQYLRMLLMMKNSGTELYFTMGAMELRMIELGEKDFRLKDYIYSAKGVSIFKSNITGRCYTTEIEYTY